jgi:two-component system chemotaxis response regulator CheB
MIQGRKIRVLIVDDSAVVRRLAQDTLNSDPEIEVIGTAADPYAARDLLRTLSPDVITLDLEMPRMDGLTFLRLLMAQKPTPVVVMSSLSQRGSDFALEALKLGAIDVIGKPGGSASFGDLGPQLVAKVKAAAQSRPRASAPPSSLRPSLAPERRYHPRSLILLGASTGGTEALREVLAGLPAGLPPIAVVQHIPAMFSRTFAERLDTLCSITVREAVHGERLEPGTALIAPGNFHLLLHWNGDHYVTRVVSGPPVWHQRPAVDLLFKSACDNGAAPHTLAGVLTGMGRDGADGLLQLRNAGAQTFAQDEATSIVYGMPRAAWENGGAQARLPLDRAASYITARCGQPAIPRPVTP